jgi:hypothetical protein
MKGWKMWAGFSAKPLRLQVKIYDAEKNQKKRPALAGEAFRKPLDREV